MGFFDRFSAKKTEASPAATPANEPAASVPAPAAGGVKARLAAARERLEARDLPAALAIYEELLATAGDRADVLVAVSGDLGSHGHVEQIIELVAPRYDGDRHGPATGLNLLQAYLAVRNADAAQHVLDILFALNRPELEERLHGFSNAIAELIQERHSPLDPGAVGAIAERPKVAMITISKPIWFYGLEPLAEKILPPKDGRLRRVAFGQLSVLGHANLAEAMKTPGDELARLSLSIPLWLTEAFCFAPLYAPVAAVGIVNPPAQPSHYMLFGSEWTTENLRQLMDSTEGGLDYVFTGAIQQQSGDYELVLRVWEMKKFRERKAFVARWTPATADEELARLHEQVRMFMEWAPAAGAFSYAPPLRPRAWLDTLADSLGLFLREKNLLPAEQLVPAAESLAHAAQHAAASDMASLAFLTSQARAVRHGAAAPADVALAASPLVAEARQAIG